MNWRESTAKVIFWDFIFGLLFFELATGVVWAQGDAQEGMWLDAFFRSVNEFWGSILFWDQHPLQLPIILVVMFGGGIFFTIRYGFVNIRLFRHAIDVVRGKFDHPDHEGEVTHFQALTSALSATVGLGNIAGVAVLLPLAVQGLSLALVCCLFGMSMKFSSCPSAASHCS